MIANSSTQNAGAVSPRLWQRLLLEPLLKDRLRLATIASALLVIALSQAVFLLMIGPFFELLVQASSGTQASGTGLSLLSLLPDGVPVPALLRDWLKQPLAMSSLALLVPLLMLASGLCRSLGLYVYQANQQYLSIDLANHYRQELFRSILKQRYLSFQQRSAGQWMSVIMNDVMYLQARFSEMLGGFLKDMVVILSCAVTIFLVHWPTALAAFLLAPLVAWGLGRLSRRIAEFAQAWQQQLAAMVGFVLSLRQRFNFIRAQRGEDRERQRFDKLNQDYLATIQKSFWIRSSFAPAIEFIGFAAFAGLLWALNQGIWFAKGFGGSELMQFFAAFGVMLRPIRNIGEQLSRLQETRGALAESFLRFETIERAEQAAADSSLQKLRPTKSLLETQSLHLSQLRLRYVGAVGDALHVSDLRWSPGAQIALVGPSGAGKSSFLKIFAGLIDPDDFEADFSLPQFRKQASYVSQSPFLFDGSLGDNLSYGGPSLEPEAALEALEIAQMGTWFRASERGWQRPIRAMDSNLSGGELQRLTIARALLRQRRWLLLDEATSALDVVTEQKLIENLLNLQRKKNRGTLFVTHRLEWLANFDEVWFFEGGKLCLQGTHSELLSEPRYLSYIQQ